ncbi:hypothetical protein [Mycobacterium attenuatum]|uniref:hypothetical protein n=1 Tax=Mycobacterium attenuatum TaxID=2341086 RepID=UPI000F036C42|nr:hypothetical protein [Mycobacterium attenuatum]VBA59599.1 hypothetical protein LAUMK41_03573 [Mycobacterium attenuatum]
MRSNALRAGGNASDTGIDELRELCAEAHDEISLAIGMPQTSWRWPSTDTLARLAGEFIALIESIGDPALAVGLFYAGSYAKLEVG